MGVKTFFHNTYFFLISSRADFGSLELESCHPPDCASWHRLQYGIILVKFIIHTIYSGILKPKLVLISDDRKLFGLKSFGFWTFFSVWKLNYGIELNNFHLVLYIEISPNNQTNRTAQMSKIWMSRNRTQKKIGFDIVQTFGFQHSTVTISMVSAHFNQSPLPPGGPGGLFKSPINLQ